MKLPERGRVASVALATVLLTVALGFAALPSLFGGGPFTGTVSGTTVTFTSKSEGDSLCPAGACTVVFTGTVSRAGAMSGTYAASYSEGPSQNGTWQLSPATTAEATGETPRSQGPGGSPATVRPRAARLSVRFFVFVGAEGRGWGQSNLHLQRRPSGRQKEHQQHEACNVRRARRVRGRRR